MNREELIELRKQVQKVIEDGRAFPADVLSAQIVLVFEQAHTPTDDEREAATDEALWDFAGDLLDAWNIEDENPPSLVEDFRDRFVARFRRTVQGEPRRDTDPLHGGCAGFGGGSSALLGVPVQGDPTDAQVEAALAAFSYRDGAMAHVNDMRAALRAAATTQEGENRG